MAIQSKDMMNQIIRPALAAMGWYSDDVAQQLMGTAAQESQMGTYLKQVEGPALGIWQIEPATHADIWNNYLRYRQDMVKDLCKAAYIPVPNIGVIPYDDILIYNLRYACLIARIKYLRSKDPMPKFGDIQGQSSNWKKNYNSASGKGDTSAYMINYERFVKEYYASM